MKKIHLRKELKTFGGTLLGTLIIDAGILFFIDSAGFYTGGVTGLSQLIVNVTSQVTNGATILNLGILIFLFQIPLIILGYLKLSRRFILYTILSIVLSSTLLAVLPSVALLPSDPLGSALAGGILIGLGNGILLRIGASSGGMAILFQYLSIKTGKSVGVYQIIFNAVIILIAGIRFSFAIAVYTIISQILNSVVIDKVHTGYNYMKLEIITDKGTEMAEILAKQLPHSVTELDAIGAYSGKQKKIIYAVLSVHEMSRYTALIHEIDPKAFIIVQGVATVLGNFKKKIIDQD